VDKRELYIIDLAVEHILKSSYWDASMADIEKFHNDIRCFLDGKVRIEPHDEQKIIVTFPSAVTTPSAKKSHGNTKLTEDDVRFVKSHPKLTAVALAKKFGCSDATIHSIRQERTWTDVVVDIEATPVDQREQSPLCDDNR
jgi:hypothetical protein